MRITYISEHNPQDPDSQSGTPYWISKGLREEEVNVHHVHISASLNYLPPLEEFAFRCKRLWLRYMKRSDITPDLFVRHALQVANDIRGPIKHVKTDIILTSLTPVSAAFLETKTPIVYWTDAVYAALANFYPRFRSYHRDLMWDGHIVTEACLNNASLLIFSSEWAARTAIEFYGVAKHKVKVVPFGANLDVSLSLPEVKAMIKARSKKCIQLLFVGTEWYRKGGDIALEVAKELDAAGHAVELTIVGCQPKLASWPSFVKFTGPLYKTKKQDQERLRRLYEQAHFLLLPARAEAYGIVLCEANAFAVPCLSTYVGGIPEIVKDGINGMSFSLEATAKHYCDYIVDIIGNESYYETLALSAYNEYQTRLNWKAASRRVKGLMAELF
jgi:glycosyltransferase involved in cell wall biosynthesis